MITMTIVIKIISTTPRGRPDALIITITKITITILKIKIEIKIKIKLKIKIIISTTPTTPCGARCTGGTQSVLTFSTGSTSQLLFILVPSLISIIILPNLKCTKYFLMRFPIFLTMYPRKTRWVQYFPVALWGTLPTQQVLQSSSLTSYNHLTILQSYI